MKLLMPVLCLALMGDLATILLILLKLLGLISLSWVWVLAPVWAPLLFIGAVLLFAALDDLIWPAWKEK